MEKKVVVIFLPALLFLSLCFPLTSYSVNISFSLQIGSERGSGNGQFYEPAGIAVSSDNRIYVVDSENNRVQIFDQAGQFIKAFGAKGKEAGQFRMPYGIAIGADGKLFVTDSKNSRVQVFDKDGGFLYGFGRDGSQDGELSYPLGIALDNQERVFVADSGNSRISVFTTDGIFLDTIGAKGEGKDHFRDPAGVAVSIDGRIWVTDTGNNRVQVFDKEWNHLASIGSSGPGRDNFSGPTGISVDPAGRIVVVDSGNNRAHILNSKGVFLGLFGSKGAGRAQFKDPQTAALWNGLCYIVDRGNNRVQAFALAKEEGTFQPFAQTPLDSRVSFHKTISQSATDIAVGSKGNLFVLDKEGAKVAVMDMDGNIAASFGSKGKKQGMFKEPSNLALDENDNIYVSDTGNDRIQVFDSRGKYLFEFGGSGSGDGKLYDPEGIIYAKGKLWVADTGNNRIEFFSKDGIYLGQFGKSGPEDGMFSQPKDIAMNSRGEIYAADFGNGRVQLFSSDGRFLKVIGKKGEGRGEFTGPRSIFVDSEDRVFFVVIADAGNKRLQILSLKDVPARAPQNVRMAAIEGDGVQLTWEKAQEAFVKGYNIYAASDIAKGFKNIGETSTPSFNIEAKKESQDSIYGIANVAKGGLEGPMTIVYPLGFLLYTQKEYEGAINELEKIIKMDSKNMAAYLLLAKSQNVVGKSGDAVNTLKTAIEINKDDINIRLELGRIYVENNLLDKAIPELQTITTMAPKEAMAYNLIGKAYIKKKMYAEAIDAFGAASRLDPRDTFKQDLNAAYDAKKRAEQGKSAGPLVDIQNVTINKVFSSLYKFYNTTPIGEIKITNNSQETFPKIKVSLKVLNYMDFPTDKEVKDVKPGATVTVPLYASFNNKILEIVEDTPAQAAIEVSYYIEQKEEKTTLSIPFTLYNRNAITWIAPGMTA
ncbi:MAG: tetratricopeptide repeat protein, partial [Deltaproteobacteria bacterium]|nr:tetratricopeptide repeat protein [Deltaproteobacteria bacterium]